MEYALKIAVADLGRNWNQGLSLGIMQKAESTNIESLAQRTRRGGLFFQFLYRHSASPRENPLYRTKYKEY
jgi:hypothetical protein